MNQSLTEWDSMGGVDTVLGNIEKHDRKSMILGINLGKNKITPNDKAINDYLTLFKRLKERGDYFVINVSSPNTPGLRELQEPNFYQSFSVS